MASASSTGLKAGASSAGELTPEEISRAEASIRGPEQAPSSRQQLGSFANWKQVQDALGQPFNNERIPLNKLKLMRRDTMIALGSHYQKMPVAKAPFYMHSSDPQVAGFMDAAVRRIWASYISARMQKFEFGFQGMAKRFGIGAPDATYVDPNDGIEKPVWEEGPIEPVIWKPFVALPPESCEPLFDDSTGEFVGIKFTPPQGGGAPAGTGAKKSGKGGSEGGVEIDIYHALWATNEKHSVFGNMYGYPRIGYAYPYWWSYWFRWAIADRAFERKGDPLTAVRHPDGTIDLGDGQEISNAEYALMIGEQMRSGATIALPSTPYMGFDDKPSAVREWDIEFVKGGTDLDPFDKSFDYLDVMKLRSTLALEQGLIEGGGGTSSRNVAAEMYEGIIEGQTLELEEAIADVNRWLIPHLMQVNFPDRLEQGVKCEMRSRGISQKDTEFLQQIVQLVGQNNPAELGVNVREALRDLDIPLIPENEYRARLAQAAEAAAASGPGEVTPGPDSAGTVPTSGRAPSTGANTPGPDNVGQGGSATGFAYVAPREQILLSQGSSDFIASLPASPHYEDTTMRALSRQLWNEMNDLYKELYGDFAEFLTTEDGALTLSNEEQEQIDSMELSVPDLVADIARRVVNRWPLKTETIDRVATRANQIISGMVDRSVKLARRSGDLEANPDADDVKIWVQNRVADVLTSTIRSTRDELQDFVGSYAVEHDLDASELPATIRAHFSEFPGWKANRFARTEARDAYNAGTLFAAQASGLTVVQAVDAVGGNTDQDCEIRDGQFFTIDQAFRESEHPNGTLSWKIIKEPVQFARVDELPEDAFPGALTHFSDDTIYIKKGVSAEDEREFLLAIGDTLS